MHRGYPIFPPHTCRSTPFHARKTIESPLSTAAVRYRISCRDQVRHVVKIERGANDVRHAMTKVDGLPNQVVGHRAGTRRRRCAGGSRTLRGSGVPSMPRVIQLNEGRNGKNHHGFAINTIRGAEVVSNQRGVPALQTVVFQAISKISTPLDRPNECHRYVASSLSSDDAFIRTLQVTLLGDFMRCTWCDISQRVVSMGLRLDGKVCYSMQ